MIILCTVDITTREVTIPSDQRIASYDHKVDVIRFQVETIPGFSLDTSSIKIAAQGPNKARHDYAVDPSTVAIEEETGYITFDWPIPQGVTEMPIGAGFKYGDKGQLIFAVCAEIIDGSTVSKAWHSDDGIITVVAHLEPEAGGGEDPEEEATNRQMIGQLRTDVTAMQVEIDGKADKIFVTPEDFGAVGDGQTDDTQALQDAVNYGALNNVYVVVPSGTYLTTNINVPQGSKIYGQKGSVLKRPNLKSEEYGWTDTQIKWSSLMTIQKTSASNDTTVIDGLEFDGNCWAMWEVSDGFKYEQAAFIACIGNSSYGYNNIVINNCYFHDNFSSGVSVRSYIDCTIKNCKSFDCFKGLFTAVGEPMILDAHDLVILIDQMTIGFDVEVNFPSDPTDQDITSVRVRNVYSEGAVTCGSGTRGSTHIYENIYSVYTADGSKLGGAGAESLSVFKNCNFVFDGNTDPPYLTVGENGIIRFEDCTFRGDGANKGLVKSGGTAGVNSQFEFVGCVFANAPYGFIGGAMRYATITMDGCVFEETITTGAVGNDDAMFVPEILNIRKCVFKNPSYILKTGYNANFNPTIFLSDNKVMNDQNTGIYTNGPGTVLAFDNDVILCKGSPITQRTSKGAPTITGKRSIITSYNPSVETIVGRDGIDDLIYEYTNADNIGVFNRYIHSGGNWILVESDNRWSEIEYSYATAGDIWTNYGISAASGVLYSTGNSDKIRTRNFIRSDVALVTANTGYKFMVFAYDSTGTYVGVWNGTAYAKANSWQTSVNIADLKTANPDYHFYIMAAKSTDTKKISVKESVNIVME